MEENKDTERPVFKIIKLNNPKLRKFKAVKMSLQKLPQQDLDTVKNKDIENRAIKYLKNI